MTSRWYPRIKRGFDAVASLVLLILLSPVLLAVAILVRAKLGAPIIFRQERPGLHGEPFTLLKFRSMRNLEGEQSSSPEDDAERLTRFGMKLRSTSLDELPELWNVVRGDMSLVGPRPLLMEYLPLYSERQARRHLVRPGITGLAQVSGRNAASWEQRFDLDVEYVERMSPRLDLAILWKTLSVVAGREGVAEAGLATRSRFTGNDDLRETR